MRPVVCVVASLMSFQSEFLCECGFVNLLMLAELQVEHLMCWEIVHKKIF